MIDEIHVENVALIREADLVPGAGLTVLTGETGAGKTALLSALKLLMGERADSSAVREGSEGALVEGRLFAGPHDEEGFVVTRRLGADGRSRARIDGGLASVRELSERVSPLIDLCGQHEHQRLLDPASHVGMVDAWAGTGVADALKAYREALARAPRRLVSLPVWKRQAARREVDLRKPVLPLSELTKSTPSPVSTRSLRSVLPRAEHAERLRAAPTTPLRPSRAKGEHLMPSTPPLPAFRVWVQSMPSSPILPRSSRVPRLSSRTRLRPTALS